MKSGARELTLLTAQQPTREGTVPKSVPLGNHETERDSWTSRLGGFFVSAGRTMG